MRHMKKIIALATLASISLIVGCSDPADKVHKSAATEPQKPAAAPAASAKEYVIRSESKIGFVGSKVTGKHNGGFKSFAGKFSISDGKIVGAPEIKIGMKTLWADNDRLTGHLKSADFFDVAKFPTATFTATSVAQEGAGQKIAANVTGNLNLHGVTKSISFPAQIEIADEALTVKSEFAINRKDFNVNYPGKPDDLIRDNVVIVLDLKATPGPARPEDQLPD
jgi:polyisoprenoid-binding protein YceI